jgi:hypothetical protein
MCTNLLNNVYYKPKRMRNPQALEEFRSLNISKAATLSGLLDTLLHILGIPPSCSISEPDTILRKQEDFLQGIRGMVVRRDLLP